MEKIKWVVLMFGDSLHLNVKIWKFLDFDEFWTKIMNLRGKKLHFFVRAYADGWADIYCCNSKIYV